MQLVILTSAVAALFLAVFSMRPVLRRRRDATRWLPAFEATTPQLSAVRVLRGEEEIQAAIAVAAGMEQRLLTIAERRYAHYRTPMATEPTVLRRPALDQSA